MDLLFHARQHVIELGARKGNTIFWDHLTGTGRILHPAPLAGADLVDYLRDALQRGHLTLVSPSDLTVAAALEILQAASARPPDPNAPPAHPLRLVRHSPWPPLPGLTR